LKVNFLIKDQKAIELDGRYLDIHAEYDFVEFDYDEKEKTFKLIWEDRKKRKLELIHNKVSWLDIIITNSERFPEGNEVLAVMNFAPSAERKQQKRYTHEKPQKGDDVHYIFQSGTRIRLACNSIIAQTL
jgi:hypothetical protein